MSITLTQDTSRVLKTYIDISNRKKNLDLTFSLRYTQSIIIKLFLKYTMIITGNVGFGTRQPMGHLDIYPNGGDTQPGCNVSSNPLSFLDSRSDVNTERCSHNRARELFRDSLISTCQTVAYECTNYNSFIEVKLLIILFPFHSANMYTYFV